MLRIFIITLLIYAILVLNACFFVEGAFSVPKNWNWGWSPRPYMARGLPEGDDEYSKGFQDGCASVMGMVAQGLVRSHIKHRYDGWKMTSDPLYATGFVDGEEHCTYFYDWDIT